VSEFLVQVTTLSNGMRVATQASSGGSVCVGVHPPNPEPESLNHELESLNPEP
jgi:hypothetical protein